MRPLRLLLASVVGALAALLTAPGPAFACSCATADGSELVDGADVVVVGTFVDRDEPGLFGDRVTFAVTTDTVLKGEVPSLFEVSTAEQGSACGLEGVSLGSQYIVFADRDGSGDLTADLCGGTGPVTAGFLDEVTALTGGASVTAGDARGAYHSELTVTFDAEDDAVGAGLALPLALASGAALLLLTGALWLRFARS